MLSTTALAISVTGSGLFSGLMLTLVVVLHRMWLSMPYERYVMSMQAFLSAAKGHPIITILTIAPIILPLLTLGQIADGLSLSIIFALIGAGASLTILFITLRLNFPVYDAIMAWEPEQLAPDWQTIRRRFYQLNRVRFVLAVFSTVCFLLALII
jgi:uncharacterized membrane protein